MQKEQTCSKGDELFEQDLRVISEPWISDRLIDDGDHSILSNFDTLRTICVSPEEGILRWKGVVVNWTNIDKGVVGLHCNRVAHSAIVGRALIHVGGESDTFTVVFEIVVVFRSLGLKRCVGTVIMRR